MNICTPKSRLYYGRVWANRLEVWQRTTAVFSEIKSSVLHEIFAISYFRVYYDGFLKADKKWLIYEENFKFSNFAKIKCHKYHSLKIPKKVVVKDFCSEV